MGTTSISALDLINLSQSIASLNLGYLGISVAILGVLGGVFVYFNIKPLKDSLDKQEKIIDELKKEAKDLLGLSAKQSEKALSDFKIDQTKLLEGTFKKQEEKLRLEMVNKVQEVEKIFSDKIENVSEDKDIKLREIILSEIENRLSVREKDMTAVITSMREDTTKRITEIKAEMGKLKSLVKEVSEEVKELQVYKYSKEGQMGAIIISIDLLESAVEEYLNLKKILTRHDNSVEMEESFSYKTKCRLEELIKELGSNVLKSDYIMRIEKSLKGIEQEPFLTDLVKALRVKISPR